MRPPSVPGARKKPARPKCPARTTSSRRRRPLTTPHAKATPPPVSLDELTPGALAFYQEATHELQQLEALPNKERAEELAAALAERTDLPQRLHDLLAKQIDLARETKRDVGEDHDVLSK